MILCLCFSITSHSWGAHPPGFGGGGGVLLEIQTIDYSQSIPTPPLEMQIGDTQLKLSISN